MTKYLHHVASFPRVSRPFYLRERLADRLVDPIELVILSYITGNVRNLLLLLILGVRTHTFHSLGMKVRHNATCGGGQTEQRRGIHLNHFDFTSEFYTTQYVVILSSLACYFFSWAVRRGKFNLYQPFLGIKISSLACFFVGSAEVVLQFQPFHQALILGFLA